MRTTLFSTLAVLMTAMSNVVFAQSNNIEIIESEGRSTLEVTYVSDNPETIGFILVGQKQLLINAFGQTSNESNGDGTCTASYDLEFLLTSPSGELIEEQFNSCEVIRVYKNPMAHFPKQGQPYESGREFLFEVDALALNK